MKPLHTVVMGEDTTPFLRYCRARYQDWEWRQTSPEDLEYDNEEMRLGHLRPHRFHITDLGTDFLNAWVRAGEPVDARGEPEWH